MTPVADTCTDITNDRDVQMYMYPLYIYFYFVLDKSTYICTTGTLTFCLMEDLI